MADLQHKHGVLLDLLGEREEEMEALSAEFADVRETFRIQLDALLLAQAQAVVRGEAAAGEGAALAPAGTLEGAAPVPATGVEPRERAALPDSSLR